MHLRSVIIRDNLGMQLLIFLNVPTSKIHSASFLGRSGQWYPTTLTREEENRAFHEFFDGED